MSKSIHSLEEKTNNFEKQKLHDVKSILLDFIAIELGFHSKCLEILTKAYGDVQSVNEEADLEVCNVINNKTNNLLKKNIYRSL